MDINSQQRTSVVFGDHCTVRVTIKKGSYGYSGAVLKFNTVVGIAI
jgi:hypothetical protein